MSISAKQARFVEEYLIDLNATQAAVRAGYSENNADVTGPRLLGNVGIAEAIAKEREARTKRVHVTQDMVIAELALIAFSDMRNFATWGPSGVTLEPSDGMEEAQTRCVSEASETVTKDGGSVRFKLHSKTEALKLLGQHFAMFTKNVNIDLPNLPAKVVLETVAPKESPEDE